MKYVKFINETTVEPAPRIINDGDIYIANPNSETLRRYGYKQLEETEPSGEAAEGWHWEKRHVELEDKVVQTWVEVQDLQPEESEAPIEEGGE